MELGSSDSDYTNKLNTNKKNVNKYSAMHTTPLQRHSYANQQGINKYKHKQKPQRREQTLLKSIVK